MAGITNGIQPVERLGRRARLYCCLPSGHGFPKNMAHEPTGLQLDVTLISDFIDKLAAEYRIDPTSVYADGFSNGGGMSFAVACRLSDRIAAVGAVAAARALPRNWCSDSKPVPMMAFHGTNDPLVPYQGVRDGWRVGRGATNVAETLSMLALLRASTVSNTRTALRMRT